MRPNPAWLTVLAIAMWASGCASVDLRPEEIAALGRFTLLAATPAMRGVVVAVPFAESSPRAAAIAQRAHESAGLGVVVAQGFLGSHAIAVTAPVEGRGATYRDLAHTRRARSVYHEYVRTLRQAAGGGMGLYVELREARLGDGVQIATVGITRSEAAKIKARRLGALSVRVEPIDTLSYDPWATRHNGVLLIPPKGLSILLPSAGGPGEGEIARWLQHVVADLQPVVVEAADRPAVLDRGRFSVLERRSRIVVAAPHGSGDTYTDEVAAFIAERLDAGLIVAHGFMGTREQTGHDRIAVNRPLEGPGIHSEDRYTRDADVVFHAYLDRVKTLTTWPPALYVEIHDNTHPRTHGVIEVATVGVSSAEALRIKDIYQEAGARVLGRRPEIALHIEGVDPVVMNAYGAKLMGILGEVPRALSIEFPFGEVMRDGPTRRAYAEIMAETVRRASAGPLATR